MARLMYTYVYNQVPRWFYLTAVFCGINYDKLFEKLVL